jgi:hypothetical protein
MPMIMACSAAWTIERALGLPDYGPGVSTATKSFIETQTEAAIMMAQINEAETDEALRSWDERHTQDAENRSWRKTATAQTIQPPMPPKIQSIIFPATIPGDTSKVGGRINFQDPNGDVVLASFYVVIADKFAPFVFDPRPNLITGTPTEGAYEFYIWCEGKQMVTLKTTLKDAVGLASNTVAFSFECK